MSGSNDEATTNRLTEIYSAIYEGAESFLRAEYIICAWFILVFSILIFVLISWGTGWDFARGLFTALSFILGAGTSIGKCSHHYFLVFLLCFKGWIKFSCTCVYFNAFIVSGYLGMKVAVYSNVRTTVSAQRSGWTSCFNTAFRAGAVMGFALCGLGIFMLYVSLLAFKVHYPLPEQWVHLTECLTGYGLGGSSIAMFGRVGGGIYTKAADVGADLVGKVVHGIPEDDPRNPATIADNVGDNVGDVAGMGSDLFGSFAEATCAALVLGSSIGRSGGWDAMVFPVAVSAVGIFVCLLCSFIATDLKKVKQESDVESALKLQLISTTILMIPAVYLAAEFFLPAEFSLQATVGSGILTLQPSQACFCVVMGAVGGLIIGLITEYYTSHSYAPVRELADSCKTGAATNMIYGIALGYKSAIIPVLVLSLVVYGSFTMCDMYGVSLAAIGFLSNLATGLTIDVYGPVCDNAGGESHFRNISRLFCSSSYSSPSFI